MQIVQNDSADGLAVQLAKHVAERLSAAISDNGAASLVVSGGSTPTPFFKALCGQVLPWHLVTITLADERWVDESSADSNAAFVKRCLLQEHAAAAKFVSLYTAQATPDEAVTHISEALAVVPRPFSVVVLGMGGDGHTASLFPGADGTEHAMSCTDAPVAIVRPSSVPQARITLTKAALNDTECQLVHITGPEKRALVDEVLQDAANSPYPIAAFLRKDNAKLVLYTTH